MPAEDLSSPANFLERFTNSQLLDYLERLVLRKAGGENVDAEWTVLEKLFKKRGLTVSKR